MKFNRLDQDEIAELPKKTTGLLLSKVKLKLDSMLRDKMEAVAHLLSSSDTAVSIHSNTKRNRYININIKQLAEPKNWY